VSLNFTQGEPLGASAEIVGTGKYDDSQYQETIVALGNATSLTLNFEVQGDDVDNISIIADIDDDGHYEYVVNCVSIAAKVLTITSPGGAAANRNYRVRYTVKNTEIGYTWADLSGNSALEEYVVRTNNVKISLFGLADDTPSFANGQVALDEVTSLQYNAAWSHDVLKAWRSGASIVNHGTAVQSGQMLQTLTLDRKVRDFLFRNFFAADPNEKFSMHVECLGPEYESSQAFLFEMYFPLVGMMALPMGVTDGRWVENGQLVVLKDTSVNDYPSVITRTRNQQDGYLA
jgi:hypothetical protein